MGQKVNPHGLRVGVIKDWSSKWYAEGNFADLLVEDYNISEPVREKMEVWFRYKMERKESYKEQGMKSLLKKTENNEGSYGANEICNLIEDCMANNWKGIIWKILEERKQQRPATRTEQIQQRVSEVDSW